MSEAIISPGVYSRENDLSFIQPLAREAGAAIIGPTVLGPVMTPTVVTSYNQYVRTFGDTFASSSQTYEFLTSATVRNYFQNGGTSMLVTRVVDSNQTFTPAESSAILNSRGFESFELQTLSKGAILNSISGSSQALEDGVIAGGDYLDNAQEILVSGSVYNLKWEITNVNKTKGTFTLLIRRGDDSNNSKVILETYTGVSLDPTNERFISKVIGDQESYYNATDNNIQVLGEYPNKSRYVRVSTVDYPTLNYFKGDGITINTGSFGPTNISIPYDELLPISARGGFGGGQGSITSGYLTPVNISANNIQGLSTGSFDDALALLENTDEYLFNTLVIPGANAEQHTGLVSKMISLAETRGDCIAIIDPTSYNGSAQDAITAADSLNSSYAASYFPWVQVRSTTTKDIWVPPSVVIPGVYAFTDASSAPWFAPAGLVRGGIPGVLQAKLKLSKTVRDSLYEGKVNPIATFPGTGIAVFGQKTLQTQSSALDRVNVRRLLIQLKDFIGKQAQNLVFEQNTRKTRNTFLARVNPYLDSVVQRQGLYAYKVVMDETNNTADVVDRNQLVGQIYIQPTKTSEFIVLDFNVQPTGASFGA